MRRNSGFTLMEVLVALAVLGIALTALVKAGSQHTANFTYVRDRTLAHWVAENKLAELQAMETWPAEGSQSGKSNMVGVDWYWRTQVESRAGGTRAVTVRVGRDESGERWIDTLETVLGDPELRKGTAQAQQNGQAQPGGGGQ